MDLNQIAESVVGHPISTGVWFVLGLLVIVIIVGIFKKALWLSIAAFVIAGCLVMIKPDTIANITDGARDFLGGIMAPLGDNDYQDVDDAANGKTTEQSKD